MREIVARRNLLLAANAKAPPQWQGLCAIKMAEPYTGIAVTSAAMMETKRPLVPLSWNFTMPETFA